MLDETENQKDTSAVKQDSSEGKQGTSEVQKPKTYDESEVQKMVSDRLAQAGRDAKTLETREVAIKKAEEAESQRQRRRDEAEEEQARGNPELLNAFQVKKQLREEREVIAKERNTFEQEKLVHQVELESAMEIRREIEIFGIAEKYGADPMTLKELNLDAKQTALVAQRIGVKKPVTPKVKHDSGLTIGGGEKSDEQRLKERYPTMSK